MYFNDTSTKNGLIQKCEDWCFGGDYGAISGNTNLLYKFTNLLNSGMDKTTSVIQSCDGRWQYDDPNRTDIAEGKTDLSNGIADYTLDLSHLKIEGVEVLDNNGDWYVVNQIDYTDIRQSGIAKEDFLDTDGQPRFYDIKGNVLTLFPAPATGFVTMTKGLKVIYQREPNYFTSTDTTTEVGLPRMYQDLPVLFACDEFCKQNSMTEKARELDSEIIKRSNDIKNHINKRNEDMPKKITAKIRSSE